jgi:hypothetical protein
MATAAIEIKRTIPLIPILCLPVPEEHPRAERAPHRHQQVQRERRAMPTSVTAYAWPLE